MLNKKIKVLSVLMVGLFVGLTSQISQAENWTPRYPVEIIAPAGPGGGWDATARGVAKALTESKIIKKVYVTNLPGGGGGVALSRVIERRGDEHLLVVYSPPLILINLTGQSKYGYTNLTPLARLACEYGAFVVRADSPYQSITEVMDKLRKDPSSVIIGGASAPGSMDHIQFLQAAMAAGVKQLNKIPYVSFPGGKGPAALLGGDIDIYSTSYSEMLGFLEAGKIRYLAITSEKPIGGKLKGVPTLKQEGIDSVFLNWRGLFAPPGISEEVRSFYINALEKMVKTDSWHKTLKQYMWEPAFLPGEKFSEYLNEQNDMFTEAMDKIGLLKKK